MEATQVMSHYVKLVPSALSYPGATELGGKSSTVSEAFHRNRNSSTSSGDKRFPFGSGGAFNFFGRIILSQFGLNIQFRWSRNHLDCFQELRRSISILSGPLAQRHKRRWFLECRRGTRVERSVLDPRRQFLTSNVSPILTINSSDDSEAKSNLCPFSRRFSEVVR
jgi:hypothetical protein